jgi:hypothetical protein
VISNHPTAGIRIFGDGNDGHVVARNRGEANGLFLDIASPDGPGTDPTGANGGAQPPVISGAGAAAATGTAPPGATVRVFSSADAAGANVTGVSGFVGSATADGSGQWVVPYATPPAAGQTIAATQTTSFGTSEFSVASSVDVAPPDTAITAGPDAGAVTNDSTPTFEFSSEAGATFECSIGGGAFGACSSPHTTAALGDGTHTLRVRASDAGLNTDPSPAERTFSVDTAAPDTRIDSAPAASSRDTTPTVAFSATEPGSRFECRLNGAGAFAACTSAHTRTVAEGSHSLEVRAIDAAGNPDATPAIARFVVDRTRPKASKLRSKARRPRGRTFTFTLSEAGATTITIDRKVGRKFRRRGTAKQKASKRGKNSVAFKGTLARGSYRASIVVTDAAGNKSKVVRTTFTVR